MWPNPQFSADLFTFTEEILKGKFHFLCSENREWFLNHCSLLIHHPNSFQSIHISSQKSSNLLIPTSSIINYIRVLSTVIYRRNLQG